MLWNFYSFLKYQSICKISNFICSIFSFWRLHFVVKNYLMFFYWNEIYCYTYICLKHFNYLLNTMYCILLITIYRMWLIILLLYDPDVNFIFTFVYIFFLFPDRIKTNFYIYLFITSHITYTYIHTCITLSLKLWIFYTNYTCN